MFCEFEIYLCHDDVIKWKHFSRYWPFVMGIHRAPVKSPHKGQWHGALVFSLICGWINGWVYNHEAGDLRRHRAQCNVTVMSWRRPENPSLIWTPLWKPITAAAYSVPLICLRLGCRVETTKLESIPWEYHASYWLQAYFTEDFPLLV